ncbi:MAG: flagellar basal-body rod protein FlgF [Pseudobdellovibrionaceae bacterium]
MSVKGIYTALSGAMAQSQKLDTISNNIANSNTPSFKRDDVVFQEYLTANEKEQQFMAVPKVPGTLDSFYHMQGGDKSFVDTKGTYTDFSQGSLKQTGNALDVAIDGKGFFEIATPQGVKLTRSGNFTLDGNGQLVTKDGYPVLAAGAGDPAERVIKLTSVGSIAIGDDGRISQGENQIAQLSMVNVKNVDALVKTGQSLYGFKSNMNAEVENIARPSMKQGFLEMSNVNIVKEMTDMISAHRVFESTQKAINAYDGMTDKLVNVVGKTN